MQQTVPEPLQDLLLRFLPTSCCVQLLRPSKTRPYSNRLNTRHDQGVDAVKYGAPGVRRMTSIIPSRNCTRSAVSCCLLS